VPTYSYRCRACSDAFDIHQSFSDASLTVCQSCGGELRKVFSPVGVSFTGSGFYRNDSRAKPDSGNSASKSSATESSGGSKSEKPSTATKEKAAASAGSSSSGSSSSSSSSSSAKPAGKSSDK